MKKKRETGKFLSRGMSVNLRWKEEGKGCHQPLDGGFSPKMEFLPSSLCDASDPDMFTRVASKGVAASMF